MFEYALRGTPLKLGYFGVYYHAGRNWARNHLDALLDLYLTTSMNDDVLANYAREVFQESGLGDFLSHTSRELEQRSDFEFAEQRFVDGAISFLKEEVVRRGLPPT